MTADVAARPRPGALEGVRAVMLRDFLVFTSRPRFLVLRTVAVLAPAIFIGAGLALKAAQDLVNIFLDHLELVRDGNPKSIVIDCNDGRRLQDTNGIYCLPEHTLRRGCVANACKRDFVTIFRKLSVLFQFRQATI